MHECDLEVNWFGNVVKLHVTLRSHTVLKPTMAPTMFV